MLPSKFQKTIEFSIFEIFSTHWLDLWISGMELAKIGGYRMAIDLLSYPAPLKRCEIITIEVEFFGLLFKCCQKW